MLYKETPFAGYCIALVTGIICGLKMHSVLYCNAAVFLLSLFLVINNSLYRHIRISIIYGLILHACIYFLGCSLSVLQTGMTGYIETTEKEFVLRTNDYPAPAGRSLMLQTSIINLGGDNGFKNNKLLLYTGSRYITPSLKPGSIIRLYSKAVEITDFNSTDNFDYRLFMNRRGFRYYAFCYDSISVIDEKPGLKHLGLRLRRTMFNRLKSTVTDERSLALVSAITLGYRELLDNDIKVEFRKSGIIHIMAVSGLHVGIISGIIILLLNCSRIKSGLVKLIISLMMIWTYALITGLSPSVTRATVMFSFLNTGYLINRPVNPLNSVMASAFLILVVNPAMIFEASFLLSYSAVIAIVINYRDMLSKIRLRGRLLGGLWKIIAISILAQAGTIPFVAFFFGEIPLLSVLANIFAIPLATIILISGFNLVLFSGLPIIPDILNNMLVYCVNILSDASAIIASWDWAVITAGKLSPVRTVILLLLSMALLRFLLAREKNNPHILLTLMILYFIIP